MIVKVCILLHTFILDNQEDHKHNDILYVKDFNIIMDQTERIFTHETNEMPVAMVSNNNEPKPRGCHTNEMQTSRAVCESI